VPLDTKYLILDRLGWEDIPNVLVAFGWCSQIPDEYWFARLKKRCRDLLLFGLDDLNLNLNLDLKTKNMENDEGDTEMIDCDWQFVCLGMGRLLTCSHELLNRQRVFRILREIKALFLQEAGKEDDDNDDGASGQTEGDIEG